VMGRLDSEFDRFVETASPSLLRLAFVLTSDRGIAEDLLQTALLRTARRWRKASDAPDAFARRVLVNLAKDRWRMLSRRPAEVMTADSLPAALLAQGEFADRISAADALLRAVDLLPRGQRTVLALRFWEDLSVSDTAQTHRALAQLERLLVDHDHDFTAAPNPERGLPTAQQSAVVVRRRVVARREPGTTE
jgi:RNA polymerase sigma factor (sigma-70 family)